MAQWISDKVARARRMHVQRGTLDLTGRQCCNERVAIDDGPWPRLQTPCSVLPRQLQAAPNLPVSAVNGGTNQIVTFGKETE
jgi:hypothetical protein